MSASSRVRLEIECLDPDQSAPSPAPAADVDDAARLTVLVVAAEADFRRYVRECLRERPDLRIFEAATAAAAVALAETNAPTVLVVAESERDVLVALPQLRAIVTVDELPETGAPPDSHVRLLVRPFSAQRLCAEIGSLLA